MSLRSPAGPRAVVACAVAGLLALPGCGGAVPAPKAFETVLDPGGQFAVEGPKGWEVDKGGRPDSPNSFVKLSQGGALISVMSDLAGSLYGDMAKAGGGLGNDQEPPAAKVHPMGEQRMKDEYSNYEEREPKVVQAQGFGEGRRSTFTAAGGMGGKIYGYRATYMGGDRRIEIICTCPATNWKALKPAFEKVITTLHR